MNWIDIKFALPAFQNKRILVCEKNGWVQIARYVRRKNGKDYFRGDRWKIDMNEALYWMLLPEPPEPPK